MQGRGKPHPTWSWRTLEQKRERTPRSGLACALGPADSPDRDDGGRPPLSPPSVSNPKPWPTVPSPPRAPTSYSSRTIGRGSSCVMLPQLSWATCYRRPTTGRLAGPSAALWWAGSEKHGVRKADSEPSRFVRRAEGEPPREEPERAPHCRLPGAGPSGGWRPSRHALERRQSLCCSRSPSAP